MVCILLLGPNRWPRDTTDPTAGLAIRRSIVAENSDLAASWILMEDQSMPGDNVRKFLHLATHKDTTHVFLVWPRDCKMAGTEDELVLWQAIQELRGKAPECYLFHQAGVLEMRLVGGEQDVLMKDPQGKSPYLLNILRRGVYEQEWLDLPDLKRQVRSVLEADLGVPPRQGKPRKSAS